MKAQDFFFFLNLSRSEIFIRTCTVNKFLEFDQLTQALLSRTGGVLKPDTTKAHAALYIAILHFKALCRILEMCEGF